MEMWYNAVMTKTLQDLLKQAETWPEEAQQELADAAFEIAESLHGDYQATAEELAGIERGLDDARNKRFATENQVKATFTKFRRA